ncbi:MAG: hypothetical protein WAM85_24925 [Terracidiphilus sp.]
MTSPLKPHSTIDNPHQPWVSSPYSLISWWDMEKFSADEFYDIGNYLGKMSELFDLGEANERLTEQNQSGELQFQIEGILESCEEIGLRVSANCARELLTEIQMKVATVGSAHRLFEVLGDTIRREMQTVLFFHLPSSQVEFYDKKELFGTEVSAKFPDLQYDIVEAGNCLALGRGTACVFHLMRIMEAGTQAFGRLLGVTFAEGKNWQNILDEINKAIKVLPKSKETVELSQISANLFSVKVAWRNQVMHPHDKYTLEEAEDVLRQVKGFMKSIARHVIPPVGSTLIQ